MFSGFLKIKNAIPVARKDLPVLSYPEFRERLIAGLEKGAWPAAFFGMPEGKKLRLYLLARPDSGQGLYAACCDVPSDSYPSLTPLCPSMHWFERELAEQNGIIPEGHPHLEPIRFEPGSSKHADLWNRADKGDFVPHLLHELRLSGEQNHEVAVGPVHAGVIEPGHFRFQCHGEEVYHLEIGLGYQHRGIERRLTGAPSGRMLSYMETLAGDTTVGHTLTHARLLEGFSGMELPERIEVLRSIALELERIANHVGDLGALAGDVAFLPSSSFCGRIRGEYLNMTAAICGNRFGRNLILPGGLRYDIPPALAETLLQRLSVLRPETLDALNLMFDDPSVRDRFEGTGIVSAETARSIGMVGVAARASGLRHDLRRDLPFGPYSGGHFPLCIEKTGDVYARASVRFHEIRVSLDFLETQLRELSAGSFSPASSPTLPSDSFCVSFVEGWRGEICHAALTDSSGGIARYKVVDPSFHNWFGLAMALRNQQIADFPICNKSFNLSYCGHDL